LHKGFDVALFCKTDIATGVVIAIFLIFGVVTTGAIGTTEAEIQFFVVVGFARNIESDCADSYDDGTITG
jgi:hypothetical protein